MSFFYRVYKQNILHVSPPIGNSPPVVACQTDLSHSLNSLNGRYMGDSIVDDYRGYEGDTRSSDYSSFGVLGRSWELCK